MNRRDFMRTSVASAAAALVPSWLIPECRPSHGIDLSAFCFQTRWHGDTWKYRMDVPFAQPGVVDGKGNAAWWGTFRYATDGRICVRVPIHEGDLIDREQTKLPPAGSLPYWTQAWQCGGRWVRWPKADYLIAADSECLDCHGTGDLEGICTECEKCGGTGHEWVGSAYGLSHPIQCRDCKGRGMIVRKPCPECHGKPIGIRPGIQKLEHAYVAAEYHKMISENLPGTEYFVTAGSPGAAPLKIRFPGGVGLVMPLETKRAQERLKEV